MQLDSRCVSLLNHLVKQDDAVNVQALARFFNVSVRSIYYDLNKINDWLKLQDLPQISIERNKGIYLTKAQIKEIIDALQGEDNLNHYVLSPKERHRLQICFILSAYEPIYAEQIGFLCDISRNTIFNDLKIVREKLQRYGLELEFETQKGYEIKGSIFTQRAVFIYYYAQLIPLLDYNPHLKNLELPFYNREQIHYYALKLRDIENELETRYVDGLLFSLASLISVILNKPSQLDLSLLDIKDIVATQEYRLVKENLTEIPENEQIYVAMHLLGSRIQIRSVEDSRNETIVVKAIAESLVTEFEQLAVVEFDDRKELIRLIASHLSMSIYRYKYGIQIGNPLMNEIMNAYPELFEITAKATRILKASLRLPIPESEVAYLAMHFGGFLRRTQEIKQEFKVLLVCPNGVSTATMLRAEVESLHPSIKIHKIVGIEEVDEASIKCDFIISTVDLNAPIPVIKVRPIITEDDRLRILSRVLKKSYSQQTNKGVSLNTILNVLSKHISGVKYQEIKSDLENIFNDFVNIQTSQTEERLKLNDVLVPSSIQTLESVDSWVTAIHIASKPLLESNFIKESYIHAMINNVDVYGPYIVLGPDIALAHALPKDGVNRLGVSLLRVQKPVLFKDRQASLIFVLAPENKHSHLRIMKDFLSLTIDHKRIDLIKNADVEKIPSLLDFNEDKEIVQYDD